MKLSKKTKWLAFGLLAMVLLTSCTAGDTKFDTDSAGFLMGLWHGFISLVTFIISIFNSSVEIYECNNNGWPYNLGFIIGVSVFFGGSSKSSCRRRR